MPKVALVARTPHRYGGKLLKVGERFDARTDADARVLVYLKRAERVSAVPTPFVPPVVASLPHPIVASDVHVPPVVHVPPMVDMSEALSESRPHESSQPDVEPLSTTTYPTPETHKTPKKRFAKREG